MPRGVPLLVTLAGLLLLGLAGRLPAEDWPQWRGLNRDGKSPETGLLKSWPAGGPKLLWTAQGCGAGFGSPAIAGGRIYLTGDSDGRGCLVVFDLQGNLIKKVPFAQDNARDPQAPGMRSTPTVDGPRVYASAPFGEVACFEVATLKQLWTVNIQERFGGRMPTWKYADSPLIDGDRLICTPGGAEATIAALDKMTGETVWTSKGLSDPAAYASCLKVTVGSLPQIVTLTADGLVGVSAATGQFLWRYNRPSNTTANCPSPLFADGRVFAASGYGRGGGAVDLKVASEAAPAEQPPTTSEPAKAATAEPAAMKAALPKVTAEQAWETRDMDCHHGGYVLVDGFIYGNNGPGWACLDWKTGQTRYKERGVGEGSLIYANGLLYCLSEAGQVGLIKATPAGHEVISRFALPEAGQGRVWAHPAIAGGRLYIRHGDRLHCYDLRGGN